MISSQHHQSDLITASFHWLSIGCRLPLAYLSIDSLLALDYLSLTSQLPLDSMDSLLALYWLSIGSLSALYWLSIGFLLAIYWLFNSYLFALDWLLIGSWLALYCLSIGSLLALYWLSIGSWLPLDYLSIVSLLTTLYWLSIGSIGSRLPLDYLSIRSPLLSIGYSLALYWGGGGTVLVVQYRTFRVVCSILRFQVKLTRMTTEIVIATSRLSKVWKTCGLKRDRLTRSRFRFWILNLSKRSVKSSQYSKCVKSIQSTRQPRYQSNNEQVVRMYRSDWSIWLIDFHSLNRIWKSKRYPPESSVIHRSW
jgi:hypothetical protein